MLDHRIAPVNDGRDNLPVPDQKAAIAIARVKDKTQPHIVALALDAIDPPSFAAKAYPPGFAHTDTINGLIGPARQGLSHCAIDMIGDPRASCAFGILMQLVFRKVMLFAQVSIRLCSFLLARSRDSSCRRPGGVMAHLMEARVRFSKQSIIQTPSCFQMST